MQWQNTGVLGTLCQEAIGAQWQTLGFSTLRAKQDFLGTEGGQPMTALAAAGDQHQLVGGGSGREQDEHQEQRTAAEQGSHGWISRTGK